MAGRARRKPVAIGRRRPPNSESKTRRVLDRLTFEESATVLRLLLEQHVELGDAAEEIATCLVSAPSVDAVAEDIVAAICSIDIENFYGSTGKKSWGYVEPGEAALQLLEKAVGGFLEDMKRRVDLGLIAAASSICMGIVIGLHETEGIKSNELLQWAPEFPAEEACYAVSEIVRSVPKNKKRNTAERLLKGLADRVCEWSDMLRRAAR